MNSAIPLETVARHFAIWRTNRQPHGSSVTPINLQQEAVALKCNYSMSEIVITLGINHSALKRWSITQEEVTPGFIALAAEEIESAIDMTNSKASCEFPNGIRLTLPVNELSSTLLQQIYQIRPELK
jgi:hypothetical protein